MSTLLICIFSVFAIILNFEGSNCIVQINSSPLFSNSSNEDNEVGNNSDLMSQGVGVQRAATTRRTATGCKYAISRGIDATVL